MGSKGLKKATVGTGVAVKQVLSTRQNVIRLQVKQGPKDKYMR